MQGLVVLGCMTLVLMILVVQVLIPLGGVSSHPIGPFKVGLIFYFL